MGWRYLQSQCLGRVCKVNMNEVGWSQSTWDEPLNSVRWWTNAWGKVRSLWHETWKMKKKEDEKMNQVRWTVLFGESCVKTNGVSISPESPVSPSHNLLHIFLAGIYECVIHLRGYPFLNEPCEITYSARACDWDWTLSQVDWLLYVIIVAHLKFDEMLTMSLQATTEQDGHTWPLIRNKELGDRFVDPWQPLNPQVKLRSAATVLLELKG